MHDAYLPCPVYSNVVFCLLTVYCVPHSSRLSFFSADVVFLFMYSQYVFCCCCCGLLNFTYSAHFVLSFPSFVCFVICFVISILLFCHFSSFLLSFSCFSPFIISRQGATAVQQHLVYSLQLTVYSLKFMVYCL